MAFMTWYTARVGSWLRPENIEYFGGTYDRRKMLEEAQRKADETGLIVTVYGDNIDKTVVVLPSTLKDKGKVTCPRKGGKYEEISVQKKKETP